MHLRLALALAAALAGQRALVLAELVGQLLDVELAADLDLDEILSRNSFDRWRAGPAILGGISPRGAKGLQGDPGFCKLAGLDSVGLQASATSRLASNRISPLKGKAEPRAIAFELMIVNNYADTRTLGSNFAELRRIGFPCHRSIARLIMSDVERRDTVGNEIIAAFMPDAFPAIEKFRERRDGHRGILKVDLLGRLRRT
jgi:hypothetical protein